MAKGADSSGKGKKAGRNGNAPPASRRWRPGQSGNPKGRPKGSVGIMRKVRELLQEAVPGREITWAEAMAKSMLRQLVEDPQKAWPILKEFIRRDEGTAGWGMDGRGEVGPSKPDLDGFVRELRRLAGLPEEDGGAGAGSEIAAVRPEAGRREPRQ